MNTASETSLNIDWDMIDEVLAKDKLPEGAVTREMIEDRYKCGRTTACNRMIALEKAGWSVGYMNHPAGGRVKYVYQEV